MTDLWLELRLAVALASGMREGVAEVSVRGGVLARGVKDRAGFGILDTGKS